MVQPVFKANLVKDFTVNLFEISTKILSLFFKKNLLFFWISWGIKSKIYFLFFSIQSNAPAFTRPSSCNLLIFLGFVFGYLGFGKLVFYLMTLQFSMVMTEQTLAAVPLFVFMGIMMEQAGLMERLFSAFQLMLAKVRG